jgi:hypothetical protein
MALSLGIADLTPHPPSASVTLEVFQKGDAIGLG